jgi:hypothetical protein
MVLDGCRYSRMVDEKCMIDIQSGRGVQEVSHRQGIIGILMSLCVSDLSALEKGDLGAKDCNLVLDFRVFRALVIYLVALDQSRDGLHPHTQTLNHI